MVDYSLSCFFSQTAGRAPSRSIMTKALSSDSIDQCDQAQLLRTSTGEISRDQVERDDVERPVWELHVLARSSFEQGLGLLEIARVVPLGEPAIDRSQSPRASSACPDRARTVPRPILPAPWHSLRFMRIQLSKPSEIRERPRTRRSRTNWGRDSSKGREIFENFVREINRLQAERQATGARR